MGEDNIEEREVYTIDNKEYNVITRVAKQKITKESLIKLIARYGIQELQSKDQKITKDWWTNAIKKIYNIS